MSKKKKRDGKPTREAFVRPEIDLSTVTLPRMAVYNPFDILPLKDQIRKTFFEIKELAGSMKLVGQVTPILVTELPEPDGHFKARLVDGERRLAALQYAQMPAKAFIWDGLTDPKEIYALSVAANFGRQPHDPVEISDAIIQFRKDGRSHADISRIFGRTTGWVSQFYSLRKLHPTVRGWLMPSIVFDGGEDESNGLIRNVNSRKIKPPLSFQLALLLTRLPHEQQIHAGKEIIGQKMSLVEARRYLAGVGRSVGVPPRHRSPGEQRSTLFSVVSGVRHQLGRYIDLPGSQFDDLLSSASSGELVTLVRSLTYVTEHANFIIQIANREMERKREARKQEKQKVSA